MYLYRSNPTPPVNLSKQVVVEPVKLSPTEMAVLEIVTAAADAGEVCPTNMVIAGRLGQKSPSNVTRCVSLLEDAGLITVWRNSRSRIVTIVDTGRRTAKPGSGTTRGRVTP